MDQVEIVIVTGMSGAGKTTAMAVFENLAYRCIDNYPVSLLTEFAEMVKNDSRYQKVAMAVTLEDAPKAIQLLSNIDWINKSVVFLDCEDNILIKRYKETSYIFFERRGRDGCNFYFRKRIHWPV